MFEVKNFELIKISRVKDCLQQSKKLRKNNKNGSHLFCDVQKLGANLYSKVPVAPFSCKKVWHWMDGRKKGRMDGKAR